VLQAGAAGSSSQFLSDVVSIDPAAAPAAAATPAAAVAADSKKGGSWCQTQVQAWAV